MTQTPMAPHRVIAERVKALRRKRGWSAANLAEELVRVGIQWDRSIVANFENGRRATISVEEMLALACVLSVSPVHLMLPPLDAAESDSAQYRVAPAVTSSVSYARAWVRGLAPLGDPRHYFAEVPEGEWAPPEWQWTPENIEAAGLMRERYAPGGRRRDDG